MGVRVVELRVERTEGSHRCTQIEHRWECFPHLCFVCANLWPKTPLGGEDSGSGFSGLDFNLVAVSEELSAEAKGFSLQGQVDEFESLPGLLLG